MNDRTFARKAAARADVRAGTDALAAPAAAPALHRFANVALDRAPSTSGPPMQLGKSGKKGLSKARGKQRDIKHRDKANRRDPLHVPSGENPNFAAIEAFVQGAPAPQAAQPAVPAPQADHEEDADD